MQIKNIIFDWSGVISEDHYPVYITCMRMFKRIGIKEISYEEFKREFELPYMTFNRKYHDLPLEIAQSIYCEEVKKAPMPKIYPEAKKVLSALKKSGYYISIFSTMTTKRLEQEMDYMKLNGIFKNPKSGIVDKEKEMKPWLKKSGLKKDETIYVADMVHDIRAAKKAGIRIASITRGYDSKEKLAKLSPDWLIDDLRELYGILNLKI